jgi:hypothetical protein
MRSKVCGACALGAALVLGLGSATNAFEDPHGAGYDGRDWEAMPQAAKLTYIAGFLAGAATMEAMERHRVNPKVSFDAAMAAIVEQHTGAFPFGVNVYKARLDDFYYYRDKRTIKVYRALVDENTRLRSR